MSFTLLLGGARSGKSELAVRLAGRAGRPVVVVATAEAGDEEMAERIRQHRALRPATWTTVEEPVELASAVEAVPDDGFVLVDCLTLWVANLLERGWGPADVVDRSRDAARQAAAHPGGGVVVSNEVGSGIVPVNALARSFRDLLGTVNAMWAGHAERTFLVVAGGVLPLHDARIVEQGS
jgi:adenosyl cobinamide kinase/adenosyl cobinamide phosphate guanylyltransferase